MVFLRDVGLLSLGFGSQAKLLPQLFVLNFELVDDLPLEDLRGFQVRQASGRKSVVVVADLVLVLRDLVLEVLNFLEVVVEASDLAAQGLIALLELLDPCLSIPESVLELDALVVEVEHLVLLGVGQVLLLVQLGLELLPHRLVLPLPLSRLARHL